MFMGNRFVKEILLTSQGWKNAEDFYDAFFKAVGAPKWHGRNLDALRDSIGTGSINELEVPYIIRITGTERMSPETRQFLEKFRTLIDALKREGIEVDLICESQVR